MALNCTSQYWAMFERGLVRGIFQPETKRRLVQALNDAGKAAPPLTVDDLEKLAAGGDRPETVSNAATYGTRDAVFPTKDGDVVIRFPAHLSAFGKRQLRDYLAIFLADADE